MPDTFIANAENLLHDLLLIPGRSGLEIEVADYIAQKLLDAGADPLWVRSDDAHRHSPFGGNSGNLIFKMPGTIPGRRRLLSAHLDTVPLCVAPPGQAGKFPLPGR